MWIFLFLSGLTSDVDACAGGPFTGVLEWGANELGKAWFGTALLDPLFEQQVHLSVSRRGKCGCACFQAAAGRIESGSSREQDGRLQTAELLWCGAPRLVALRDKAAFEVWFGSRTETDEVKVGAFGPLTIAASQPASQEVNQSVN